MAGTVKRTASKPEDSSVTSPAAALATLTAFGLVDQTRLRIRTFFDPQSDPRLVLVADGLVAATAYFLLRTFFVAFLSPVHLGLSGAQRLTFGALFAAGVTVLVMRETYARRGVLEAPRFFGPRAFDSARDGLIGGVLAAGLAAAYMIFLEEHGWLNRAATGAWLVALRQDGVSVVVFLVFCAPMLEELIFRGLIFSPLRRRFSPWAAAAISAAVFALVHPVHSMIPVFVLGLITARVRERTPLLAGPMLVHALYNAAVLTTMVGLAL